MRGTHLIRLCALAALALPTKISAQIKTALTKPDHEFAESFTRITSVRELPSGKVLISDLQDKVVNLIDFAAGSVMKVGREGRGPGEYSTPATLIELPDGSTLLHDIIGRRFLSISPDGKPGDIVDMPKPPETSGAGPRFVLLGGIQNIRGSDNLGRIYFEGSPLGADGGSVDSVPLLRWDRVKPTYDTVGFRKLPPNAASSSVTPSQARFTFGNTKRFTPTEAWGVAGDGSIARVIPDPYRVAWISGKAQPVMGQVVPYTPIKVTEAEKKEITEAQRSGTGGGTRIVIGGGTGTGGAQNIQLPPPEFNDTKPPFDGAAAVAVTPEGEAWVLRTRRHGDETPTYDVFNRSGALVKSVSLNPRSRVLGFGKGTVYVARTDEDDLQYLQRYKRP
ncbi:MAG: hypothetical protein HOP28_06235 [Gemmatimonadales bacterium]|nr:hypothetical protein [Gemmatimonadales bacterium]